MRRKESASQPKADVESGVVDMPLTEVDADRMRRKLLGSEQELAPERADLNGYGAPGASYTATSKQTPGAPDRV